MRYRIEFGSEIEFSVRIDWPKADVDVVLAQASSFRWDKQADRNTPIAVSVNRFLDKVYDDPEVKALRFEVESSYDFMMGCCSIKFTCAPETFQDKKKMDSLRRRLSKLVSSTVRYHKNGEQVGRKTTMIGVSR